MLWQNLNHLMNGTVKDLLYGMARTSREYIGDLDSFNKEWEKVILERPDILWQFWLYHTMVRNIDTDAVGVIASRIRALQTARIDTWVNTDMLDHYDQLMNTLTHAYDFHLVRCPECATITECPIDSEIEVECPKCTMKFTSHEAPDLFF